MLTHIARYKGKPVADCNMICLPTNLLANIGTLYEDFEAQADWTNEAGSHADNTSEYLSGTKSQKVTSLSGSNGRIKKPVDWDLSSFGRMVGYVYIHDTLANYTGSAQILLSNETGQTNTYRAYLTQNRFTAGWNIIACEQAAFGVNGGSPSWASHVKEIAVLITGAASQIVHASWDKLYFGLQGIPAVMIGFDDGFTAQYTTCFAYMKPLGIRASIYVPSSYINGTNRPTTAQLKEIQAAGWTLGNHTQNHVDLTTLTEAQQETELNAAITDYANLGIPNSVNKYLAYVSGNFNSDTLTAMANIGLVTGRTVYTHTNMGANPGLPAELYKLAATTVTNTTAVATVTGWIDSAITSGNVLPLTFHEVGASGNMTAADFKLVIDYIYTKWKAGLIYPITIDDLYHLSLGPWKVPKVNS